MAYTVNRAEILGRLGRDPEMRYTGNGTAVANLGIATDRYMGEDQETQPEWHNVTVWGKLAEAVSTHMKKGERIYVSGELRTRTWEDDKGVKHYTTEIHARDVVFLNNSNGNGAPPPTDDDAPYSPVY